MSNYDLYLKIFYPIVFVMGIINCFIILYSKPKKQETMFDLFKTYLGIIPFMMFVSIIEFSRK